VSESSPQHESEEPTPWFLRRPFLVLLVAIVVVYFRVLSAGFVSFDDDIHVYANPFLNPPTLESVARLWQKPYEELYVPLAYTIFAAIAAWARVPSHVDMSVGHPVSLDPAAFHVVSVALHVANAWLCFLFARRLTRRTSSALICALVFALHPLALESVGWISELRGLTSSFFALLALNGLILARQTTVLTPARSRSLLAASALSVACAMLCKPSAVVLPLVALVLDRTVLETPWRRALALAASWAVITVPFAVVTHSLQAVSPAGQSLWWQRPFIAGDALAFYLFKTFVPLDLCVDYGRTPSAVMSHAWGYLAWVVPLGLLALCYSKRRERPLTFVGALLFVAFLLPTLGLLPFSFQAYSTVADRYTYLALIGIGLVVADVVEHLQSSKMATRTALVALVGLAIASFEQSRFWSKSSDLLRHTLDVNPDAAFAENSLGDVELGNGDSAAALADYQACVRIDPTRTKAYINLAEIHAASAEPAEAESAVALAMQTPALTADDYSNLGIVLMKMNQPARALQALETASTLEPSSPVYLYNEANGLSAAGQFDQAEAAFRRCISLAPALTGAHTGLGIVLAETQRLPAALEEFRTAVRLEPSDPAALDDLKKVEALMEEQKR
jgi:protein O-mannosyl-transferase